MNDEINYKTNPLHGVSLKKLLNQLVDHYGFEILFAYLNINCFKTNPSIDSSVIFLKKTDWAREKVEVFYLYKFKNLPDASSEQFRLPPRDRIVPDGHAPGEPAKLSLEDAQELREERDKKTTAYRSGSGQNYGTKRNGGHSGDRDSDAARKDDPRSSFASDSSADTDVDPWAKSRK